MTTRRRAPTHPGPMPRPLGRRAALAAALSSPLFMPRPARAASAVRVGVLRFGTVAWELDVVRAHGLDRAAGVAVEPVEFAASQATQVALQAGHVDAATQDWLWVARQRASGADYACAPSSAAVGAVVAPQASPVRGLADLDGRRLGIAGSPLDKSWLILRAHARKSLGLDLDARARKNFGPPPLLAEQLAAGRLDAALTYWPFVARAEAGGMRRVVGVEEAVRGLGIAETVPFVGYAFSEGWAARNRAALDGFLAASRRARAILAERDEEWQRIAPLTGAAGTAELHRLRDAYRAGVLPRWGGAERAATARLYDVLAEIGGPALVGPATRLPPGTFWETSA